MSPDGSIGGPGKFRKAVAQHINGIDCPVCSGKLGKHAIPLKRPRRNVVEQHYCSIGSVFRALCRSCIAVASFEVCCTILPLFAQPNCRASIVKYFFHSIAPWVPWN